MDTLRDDVVARALAFVAEFHGDARCSLNCIHAEALVAEVHRLRAALAAPAGDQGQSEAERTVRSIAVMLGWMNVPPRETLEADIRALKARASAPAGEATPQWQPMETAPKDETPFLVCWAQDDEPRVEMVGGWQEYAECRAMGEPEAYGWHPLPSPLSAALTGASAPPPASKEGE